MDTYKLEVFHEALLKLLEKLEKDKCPICKGVKSSTGIVEHAPDCELSETIEALGNLVHNA